MSILHLFAYLSRSNLFIFGVSRHTKTRHVPGIPGLRGSHVRHIDGARVGNRTEIFD